MASPFNSQTVESRNSIVKDQLKPNAEIHMLIGGPYTSGGEEHRYGHTALRVKRAGSDLTYDFGRYGRITGDLGAEGEGILRVWKSFDKYISGENALGRSTIDYTYLVFDHQARAVEMYFNTIIDKAKPRSDLQRGRPDIVVYQLPTSYHALKYNCTTISLDAIRAGIANYERGSTTFIAPEDVLTMTERVAMNTIGGGTPTRIFLPANLKKFLDTKPAIAANQVRLHGKSR
ncbi:hypothetical protein HTY52_22990 [Cupriavidus taiwanensis]|nr:hypothetical protein [Cupriavidus taiwanensis]